MGSAERTTGRRDHKPAANPLSAWTDHFLASRRIAQKKFGLEAHLPGISTLRTKRSDQVSQYSIDKILKGAELYGASIEELAGLRIAVAQLEADRLQTTGRPPRRVFERPREIKVVNGERQYRDPILAEELHEVPANIQRIRKRLGITNIIYNEEDAQRVRDYVSTYRSRYIPGFARNIATAGGISVDALALRLGENTKDVYREWNVRGHKIPRPEQFGVILQAFGNDPEALEKIVDIWLDEYRKTITRGDIAKEKGTLSLIVVEKARDLGIRDARELSWEDAEKLRKSIPDKVRKTKGTSERKREVKREPSQRRKVAINVQDAPKASTMETTVAKSGNEVRKNNCYYPNVLTDSYLGNIMPSSATAVRKLEGTSSHNPAHLTKEELLHIHSLVKYGEHPPGARIRVSLELSQAYLEYSPNVL
ncbi:MAG: hypothetical protein ACM3IJ_03720 [Candidatus Levyibacteriota bacterium]